MFQSLPGFRAFYPEDACLRDYIFSRWRRCVRSFNFLEYDAPVLEPLELFTQKSGAEIVKQLFHFEDQGGRAVALRPEMTPSLARLVGTKGQSLKRPLKWFSIAECFRYERPQKGRLRSFYQLNVDLLGEASSLADAECIQVIIQSFRSFGLTDRDFAIRLSDRALWSLLLESFGLSPEDSQAVLPLLDKLDGALESAREDFLPYFKDKLDAFIDLTSQFLNIKTLKHLENFIHTLWPCEELLAKAKLRLQDWTLLLSQLEAFQVPSFIRIDFSIVRGLAYYTGFVFEAFEATGQGRALAGGGRYDDLLQKLSGVAWPAVGFGLGDVTLGDILREKGLLPQDLYMQYKTADVFIAYDSGLSRLRSAAFSYAHTLREQGYKVDYSLKDLPLAKQERQAYDAKVGLVLSFQKDEQDAPFLKIKHLASKEERLIPIDEGSKAMQCIQNYLGPTR